MLIAVVVVVIAAAFVYTAGWFTPSRLAPAKVVDTLAPPTGPALGFRRNHAKGICFTPQAFYELQVASARKDDSDAMKNFAAAHPEIGAFGAWASSAPFTGSYAENR